jgi:hypothetical protein
LMCYRYIELNPVRTNRVPHPRDYRWSSFLSNAEGRKDSMLTAHPEYLRLGRTPLERQIAYNSLFRVHLDPEGLRAIRDATNGNFVLGGQRFQQDIADQLKRRVTPGKSGRPVRKVRISTDHPQNLNRGYRDFLCLQAENERGDGHSPCSADMQNIIQHKEDAEDD